MSTKSKAFMTLPTRVATEVVFWFSPLCRACGRVPVLQYEWRDDGRAKLIGLATEPDDQSAGTHICLLLLAVFLAGISVGSWISALG